MPVWHCGRSPREAAAPGRAQKMLRYPGRCRARAARPARKCRSPVRRGTHPPGGR
jgi:hypothetical protein